MPQASDRLRYQINVLQLRRRSLESKLLQPRTMLPASLIERYLGCGTKRRSSPAYYVSRSVDGRSKLTYVKKEALTAVRQQCDAHRSFQQLLADWRRLTAELDRLWEQLQQSQSA
jgi:hypothetical protein